MGDAVGYLAAFLAENVLSIQKAPKAGCHGTRLPFKQLKRLKQEDHLCPQVQHVWHGETLSLQSKAQVFLGISEGIVAFVKRCDCRASSCNHYFVQFPREGSIHPISVFVEMWPDFSWKRGIDPNPI